MQKKVKLSIKDCLNKESIITGTLSFTLNTMTYLALYGLLFEVGINTVTILSSLIITFSQLTLNILNATHARKHNELHTTFNKEILKHQEKQREAMREVHP